MHALCVAAVRFERLLRRRRDKLAKENPFLAKDVRARFDEDLEVVRRYTHSLNAEAQVALAVRDAFDCANNSTQNITKFRLASRTTAHL